MKNNRHMELMSNLIESISMGPFGSDVKVEYFTEKGIPFLSGENLTSIKMNDRNLKYFPEEKAEKLSKAIVYPGDIVVTHRGTLGQLSYVPDDLKEKRFLISQSQFKVTLKKDLVNPVWFAYYFHTKEGQKRLLSFANYVGVPALATATTNFKGLEIPLPKRAEQDKIADFLSNIDSKIANNNAISKELESTAKTIYDYWFLQFEFPDKDGKPYKSSGGKMVWNDQLKQEIPEGWEVGTLDQLFRITMGTSPQGNTLNTKGVGVEFYQGSTDFGNIYPTPRVYTTDSKKTAEAQDILLSVRAPVGALNLALNNCSIGRGLASIHFERSTIFAWNKMNSLKGYFDVFNGNGTTFGSLTGEMINKLVTVIPSNKVIEAYTEETKAIEEKLRSIQLENQELKSLRDFLLPMLMNGQVTIKD